MTTCRSCPAEVIFVPSAKSGARMILDAKPEKRVILLERGAPLPKVAQVVDAYTDHHATCPRAGDWRRK